MVQLRKLGNYNHKSQILVILGEGKGIVIGAHAGKE